MKIEGKYTKIDVKIDNIDEATYSQLVTIANLESFKETIVKVMPDCHAGKGCVVGFTAYTKNRIIPNIVGVDISCTVSSRRIREREINLKKLDEVIRKYIPSGINVRKEAHAFSQTIQNDIEQVCRDINDLDNFKRHLLSLGTLGGGNHYIELNQDEEGYYWLTIHCGSRNFGLQICNFHQKKAMSLIGQKKEEISNRKKLLSTLEASERESFKKEIDLELKKYDFDKSLSYLEGDDLKEYIKHMKIAQKFATLNHTIIREEILKNMNLTFDEEIVTNHNYIEELEDGYMIRKGAINASLGNLVIIPFNMRDGSFICKGKGNKNWNNSAPHGAGRILSRMAAKKEITLEEYKKSMEGIYSTSVHSSTIDESPFAYKPKELIVDAMKDSVDVVHELKVIYNFKAS